MHQRKNWAPLRATSSPAAWFRYYVSSTRGQIAATHVVESDWVVVAEVHHLRQTVLNQLNASLALSRGVAELTTARPTAHGNSASWKVGCIRHDAQSVLCRPYNVRQHEDVPSINARRPLFSLVNRALQHEIRQNLLNQLGKDYKNHEDTGGMVDCQLDRRQVSMYDIPEEQVL